MPYKTSVEEAIIQEFSQQIANNIPLARFARSEEIASAIAYLALEEASYISLPKCYRKKNIIPGWLVNEFERAGSKKKL